MAPIAASASVVRINPLHYLELVVRMERFDPIEPMYLIAPISPSDPMALQACFVAINTIHPTGTMDSNYSRTLSFVFGNLALPPL